MEIFKLLEEPLKYNFFIYANLAIIAISIISSFIGFIVVNKGIMQLTSGISNSMLLGYYFASITGVFGVIGSIASSIFLLLAIFITGKLQRNSQDQHIAIIGSLLFSIAIIFITRDKNSNININNLLFGNILGISVSELIAIYIILLITLILTFKYLKIISYSSFAMSVAKFGGIGITKINIIIYIFITIFIAFISSLVGIILTLTLIITPIMTSKIFFRKILTQYKFAITIGIISGVSGIYLSYFLSIPSGPAITLTSFIIFILSLWVKNIKK